MRTVLGRTKLLALLAIACVLGVHVPSADAHGDHDEDGRPGHGRDPDKVRGVTVQNVSFHVTLSDSHTYRVAGYVYAPRHPRHKTVQLLVHGATYNHEYWDAPELNHERYSYARDMVKRGYVVVAIDQLGTGNSDKPNGDFFSLDEAASTLHQVSGQARAYGGPSAKLAYVGHSNGSITSIYAQGTYRDADLLVSTAWVHGFRGLPFDPSDPMLQNLLASPYITLTGPARAMTMYYAPKADPAMIAYDDAHLSDVMPRRQFLDLIGVHVDITSRGPGGMTQATRSQLVDVPTLVQAGERDDFIAPASSGPPAERAFFPLVQDFTFQQLPQIGHVFNLHVDHERGWDQIDEWIGAHE